MKKKWIIPVCLIAFMLLGCDQNHLLSPKKGEPEFKQGDWTLIYKSSGVRLFRSICFSDPAHGWAAGDSGIILHTDNGWRVRHKLYLLC